LLIVLNAIWSDLVVAGSHGHAVIRPPPVIIVGLGLPVYAFYPTQSRR